LSTPGPSTRSKEDPETMSARLLLLILSLVATDAMAAAPDNSVVPQPLAVSKVKSAGAAPSGKPAPAARLISPTVSETRVTRNADGTLAISCVERPNPKAQALRRAQTPQSDGAAQP
jgi:hypothetical protein